MGRESGQYAMSFLKNRCRLFLVLSMFSATLFSATFYSSTAWGGALPVAVDGQPLPSLAPMLEKVTPAVVNISTVGRVRQSNGLMDDPFFRHRDRNRPSRRCGVNTN